MEKSLDKLSDRELWQLFPIIISEHNNSWKTYYQAEEKIIERTIGKNNIWRMNHIGSTYIPDLLAKPTIDILLEIKKDIDTTDLIQKIQSIGYIYNYQPLKPPPHMMFMKGYTSKGFEGQAYHLHIRYPGDWDELYFRDYLLRFQKTAREYEKLKLDLKNQFEHDRDKYTEGKSDFIRNVTKRAKAFFPDKYLPDY